MDLNLRGKTAVITGASKGIGFAVASALAEEGCDLHIVSRSSEGIEKAA
ncbi:MAG: SDR family NAD(P)-dependent oxidoreductase, partial [Betaproteobacteria bacterium]